MSIKEIVYFKFEHNFKNYDKSDYETALIISARTTFYTASNITEARVNDHEFCWYFLHWAP